MDVVLPKPGTYVVGVSGGVDSRVLLDVLHKHSQGEGRWNFIVAHLDHGIRSDSVEDRKFVQALAHEYGLPFVYNTADLGAGASEARARAERYTFLNHAKVAGSAQAVITAHHQDDLLETAIINIVRGSGRKGITALGSRSELLRPLLGVPKSELISYAQEQGLKWHEDSTNQDDTYLRNYIRHNVVPRFDDQARAQFLAIIGNLQNLNSTLDALLTEQLQLQDRPGTITRLWFNSLPHIVAKETLAAWLRSHELRNFDSKTLERLVVHAKSGHAGQQFPVPGNYVMKVGADYLALEPAER
jgi:tRNA(Ile)-lysidine synthetase-like protein